uniref:F-box domain-containing protein n=1 Tax=Panagrellus redivivus TaxID=6233 RepID=A0A7E4VA93_PANRE
MSTLVPFNLLSLSLPMLRNFIDIMPLKDLYTLRKNSDKITSLSHFRGDIVQILSIITDNVEPWDDKLVRYSDYMNQAVVKPYSIIYVYMGSDICPEALLAKMEEQVYHFVFLADEYDWKQVITFLHAGVTNLNTSGIMHLPEEDMETFLKRLSNYKVKDILFSDRNCVKIWFDTACKTWNSLIGTFFKTVEVGDHYPGKLMAITQDDAKIELYMNYKIDVDLSDDEFIDDNVDES